jgi:hypothetical protein
VTSKPPFSAVRIQTSISDYCEDINGWDAHVYCEEVTAQEGSFVFGRGVEGVNSSTISFPKAFASVPLQVVVTPSVEENVDFPDVRDVFAITTQNITRASFQVNVVRTDSGRIDGDRIVSAGWNQNLRINWRASGAGVLQPN